MKPIEYIGPVPNKKKSKPKFGGAIIVVLVSIFVFHFAWPYIEGIARASQDQPNSELAQSLSDRLRGNSSISHQTAGTAIHRSNLSITYDPNYFEIDYPMGDIPSQKGTNVDLVIRALRGAGVDLQQLIHQDMSAHFNAYPQLWDLKEPNSSMDHRRIENINRYLYRFHNAHPTVRHTSHFDIGNIVIWRLPTGQLHIGIAVPGPGVHENELWVVHNLKNSPKWEDSLFDYEVVGNFSIRAESVTSQAEQINSPNK